MTLPELVQLYAPLAGMLAMSFWLGVLQERVRAAMGRIEKLEVDDENDNIAESPAVVRLETQVGGLSNAIDKLTRSVEGIQRQLGNLMTGKSGQIVEFKADA